MEWLNLHKSTLDSSLVKGATATERGIWLALMAYCIGQENHGVIAEAGQWTDRTWLSVVGISLNEANIPSELWTWDDNNLRINLYPSGSQAQVQANRQNGRNGGMVTSELKAKASRANGRKGGRKPKQNPSTTQARTQRKDKDKGNSKDKGKDKDNENQSMTNQSKQDGDSPLMAGTPSRQKTSSELFADLDSIMAPPTYTQEQLDSVAAAREAWRKADAEAKMQAMREKANAECQEYMRSMKKAQ